MSTVISVESMAGLLSGIEHRQVAVHRMRPVGGGCINSAWKVETDQGVFFLKANDAHAFPGMFESEARGLNLLQAAGEISVPQVKGCGETERLAWLCLEWIEPGRRDRYFFTDFGRRLAALHRHSSERFGLDHDNYIGALP